MLVAAYMQLDVIIVFMGSACCGIAIEMQARFCSFEKIQPITLKLLIKIAERLNMENVKLILIIKYYIPETNEKLICEKGVIKIFQMKKILRKVCFYSMW
jgi:hypothetical protein